MYVNTDGNLLNGVVNTLAHEGMHVKGAGEATATVTGYLTDWAYQANAWANSEQIATAANGLKFTPMNEAANQDLLNKNNSAFQKAAELGELDYRTVIYVTDVETGESYVNSRTKKEQKEDKKSGLELNKVTTVPKYLVEVKNDSGEEYAFEVTRHAFRDEDGDGKVEDKTFQGTGLFGAGYREDGALGPRYELTDMSTGKPILTEPNGTTRENIQIHLGPGASGGCIQTQVCNGVVQQYEVMNRIEQMRQNDAAAGYGDDLNIFLYQLSPVRIKIPE